jgi:hypothetical protein
MEEKRTQSEKQLNRIEVEVIFREVSSGGQNHHHLSY